MGSVFRIAGFINYLVVVFLNAFTDLGHKIIIQNTVFKVYDGSEQIVLTTIVNALILLPFVLVFSPSGFLSDRYPKNLIMKHSALLAVAITLAITLFYYLGWFYMAFFMTFLLALQSAIYSPAKYGYVKELAGEEHLSAANGALQAVTTVAILGGILFYTILFENFLHDDFVTTSDVLQHIAPLGWFLVGNSLLEWYLASKLPNKQPCKVKKHFSFKRYKKGYYLFKNIKILKRKQEIWENIIALSLFWSISQVILAIFGEYAKSHMGITNAIYVQGVMALSGFGIVAGSIIAAKLSRYYINVGIATLGAIGITLIVFSVAHVNSLAVIAVLFLCFGIFSGFVLVPLNANIQLLSPNVHLGTIIAGNNFVQNIFMISFLIITSIFAFFGMDATILFTLMGFAGAVLFLLLFRRYFIMSFWALAEVLFSFRYKLVYEGLEHVKEQKKALLLLGNHVSWLDWFFIQLPFEKRVVFMIDKEIYYRRIFHFVLRYGSLIPLSPKGFKDAFRNALKRLKKKEIVALFPEGKITTTCKLEKIKKGFEIIEALGWEGVVVPFYIDGMQGSLFAKCGKKRRLFQRRVVRVVFLPPQPKNLSAKSLEKLLQEVENVKQTKA